MAGIYIHVPFCRSKCAYCDFYSIKGDENRYEDYADTIIAEWYMRRGEIAEDALSTLYLGGGTPSLLPIPVLERIFKHLPIRAFKEITIEANPDDVTAQWVSDITGLGINRVSMGVQSFSDTMLAELRRRHGSSRALEALRLLREGGIRNLSLDLIYGIPAQTLFDWESTLQQMFSLRPEHLSAYILSYEPGTLLSIRREKGKITPVDDDTILRMYEALCEAARVHGYEHYEISNFALPGFRSNHNSSYWDFSPYLGLGPAAHSFDGTRTRRINPSSLKEWSEKIALGMPAFIIEEESDMEIFNDYVITSLRTREGMELAPLQHAERQDILKSIESSLTRGELIMEGSRLVIPERHWPMADSIMEHLIKI